MKDLAEPWLPLAGVRVVDFSMFVPGPFASAMQLAPELNQERFSSDALRRKNGDELSGLLSNIIKARPAPDWLRLLEENDVPVDLCVTPGEAVRHSQLEERQALERGYAKFPVWANGRRGGRIRAGTPGLGEHTREILVELGFDDSEIADLVKTKTVFSA